MEQRRVLDAAGLVADINPNEAGSQPAEFAQFNGNLYFTATGVNDAGEFVGRELYRVDSGGNVALAADINPGAADSSPSGFTTFNGNLYFAATAQDGRELFKIDSTGLITQVADINAGIADSAPAGFTPFNGSLYFAATAAAGRELFKIDTSENVSQVEDIFAGPASSNPEGFTEYDGKLYFAATAEEGRELFLLNRGNNVNQIADINPGGADANPDGFLVFNDFLYFAATSDTGRTLYRQNPSGVNPVQILDPALLANPEELTVFDGNLYFRADNLQGDSDLFYLDTDEAITNVLTSDASALGDPSTFTLYNGTLYFAADTDAGRSLFRLDTSSATITAVEIPLPVGTTIAPGEPAELAEFPLFAGDLYFAAMGPLGSELYQLEPNDNIQLVSDINVGPTGSDPAGFIVFGNALYFAATTEELGRELYRVIPSSSTVEIIGNDLVFTDIAGDMDNRLIVSSDGALLHIIDENGHEIASSIPGATGVGTNEVFIPLSSLSTVDGLVVDTRGGDDSLTLDLSSSAASILAQFPAVFYDGGTNNVGTRGDVLRLVGDTTTVVTVTPDAAVPGAGLATLTEASLVTQLTFVGLEPVDVTGMALATLLLPGVGSGADDLTITDGVDALDATVAALVVSGSTAGTTIESVHFFANQQVVVDASAGADGNDHVALSSASGAHANVNLSVDTGQAATVGGDVVAVTGDVVLAGDFQVVAGRFTLASSVLVGGSVDIAVQEDVELFAGATVTASGAGSIHLVADSDQSGNEALIMTDGSVVQSQTGEIVLEAGGDVQLGQLITGNTGEQAIQVTSRHGSITDGGDTGGADLVASAPGAVVILQAAGSIGNSAAGAVDTEVPSIDALAETGDIFLNELDDLNGFHLVALFGLVDVRAAGGLFDAPGDTNVDLAADRALIVAAQIGDAANPIETQLQHLEADAGPGSLWIAGDGDLEIGSVSASFAGISAAQAIALSETGTLTITEAIDSDHGPITLSATDDLTLASSITSGGGSIALSSGGRVILTSTALVDAELGAAGILFEAVDSIELADLSMIDGRDGDVTLVAGGDITLSDIRTTAQIQATSGGAILDTADSGGVDLTASSALLAAATGIGTFANPLETALEQLEADAGAGGLWMGNQGNLQIGGLSAAFSGIDADQEIALATTGTLSITEAIDSAAGPITFASTGDLNLTSSITSGGGRIELTSGAAITLSSTALVDTELGSAGILLSAAHAIELANLSLIDGRDGDVTLTAGDSVTLSEVRTTAGIQISSGGAILDTVDAGGVDLTASTLQMIAALGIGTSSNPLETTVSHLEAEAGAGDLWLINQGSLEVGNVTLALQGISAGKVVSLQNAGDLSITEAVTAAQGPLTLTVDGAVTVAAAVTSGSGFLQIDSTGALSLTPTASVEVQLGAAGLLLQSGASIDMSDGSMVQGADGLVDVQAVGDVTLSDVRTTAQIRVTSGGAILDTADAGGADLTASSALLTAAAGIGTAVNPLETTLSELEADAGSGGLWLDNQGNLEVGGVSPLFTGIVADQEIALSTIGTLTVTETVDSNEGPITLSSTDDLSLTSSITSGGGAIALESGGDITLASTAVIDAEQGVAGITLDAAQTIQLTDLSLIDGRDGDVALTAGGDITLSDLRTTAQIRVTSGGAILDTADAGGVDLTASIALLSAAAGIGTPTNPLETSLPQLEADAGAGGLWLTNTGDAQIGGISVSFSGIVAEQAIVLINVGTLSITETIDSAHGPITVSATDDLSLSSSVTSGGGRIEISSGGSVTLSPVALIDVEQGSDGILVEATGAIQLADLSLIDGRDGDVALTAGGDVTLSDVRTTAQIRVTSGGAILDTSDSAGTDLTASSALLMAAAGIGTAVNPLETALSELEADAGSGGFWLDNQGNLAVGGVSPMFSGIVADQEIALSTLGTLTVTETVDSGQGPVTLSSTDDLSLTSSITSGGGAIALDSGGDITLASTAVIDAEQGAAGITLDAAQTIQLTDLSLIDGRDGDVALAAGGDVTLSDVRTTAQIRVTSGGAILDTADAGGVDLTASSALLSSAAGIGTPTNPLETSLPQLEADAGTGGLWLTNTGDAQIGGISAAFSGITAEQAIVLINEGTLSITETIDSAHGPITVSATDDLSLSSSVTSGGGRIEISSGGSVTLSSVALIDVEDGSTGILVEATGAIQLADLSLIDGRDGDVALTAGGDVTLSDVRTTAQIRVTSGGAILDTADAGGVDLTASSALLMAAAGIGTAVNPLETTLSELEADAGSGGLWLDNQGNLEVGGVSPLFTGIVADQEIALSTVGTLTITETVDSGQGPVTLSSTDDLSLSSSITSGGGAIALDSGGDITLASTAVIDAEQGAAGITLDAAQTIQLTDLSLIDGRDGDVALAAGGDVTLSDVRTTAQIRVTSGGAILDTADAGGVDLTASSALLSSAAGIGTSTNPLETVLPQLEADAGTGGLWLTNTGDAQIGGISVAFSGIVADQAIVLINAGTLSITETIDSAHGPITISATDDLSLSSSITSGGGRIEISSGGSVTLTPVALIDVENGSTGILVEATGTIQLDDVSLIEGRDGDVTLMAGGNVTLSDVRTTAQIRVTSGGAILDTADAGGVDLTASSALLMAAFGIGTAVNPLETTLSELEADAGSGGFWLDNQGNLEVGGVSPLFTGIVADQEIALSTVGTLTVTETVDSGQGPVTLSSTDDLSLSSSITSGGGRIEVVGGNDITLSSSALIDTQTGAAGILLQAAGAIRLDNGSVIQARDGDIHLDAGGDVVLSDVRTSALVQIDSGGAILDTDDSGGLDITADQALLFAAVAIGSAANPIETQINSLQANAAPGGVWLNNVVELTVGGTFAGDNVEIVAAGGIAVVEMLITGGGNLLLDAGGTIRVLAPVTTDGGSVLFNTDGDLLFSPDGSIDVGTGSAGVVFQVAGDVVMEDGSFVNARDGDVTIVAGGSVTLSDVSTTAAVSIISGGGILDTADGAGVDLTAGTASLAAADGIGTAANPLETVLSQLEADAGAGGFWLTNQGDLEVGSVDASLTGITAAQEIALSNIGSLTITETVDSAQGPITLSATGDLSLSSSITSGGGRMEISSGNGIFLTPTALIDAEQGAAGILLDAAAAIQLADFSVVDGRDGDVTLLAGSDVRLSDVRTTAQIQVTSGGAILDTSDAGAVDLTAAGALLSAAAGIGTPANPLETALPNLEADAGAGGLWLSNQGDLEIGGVSPLFSGITAGQAISLANEGTLLISETIDSAQGPITLSSTDDLTLSSSITSGGGRIELSSGTDIALTPSAVIDAELGAAGIMLEAADTIQLADLSLVQGRDGNVTLLAGGNVTLSDIRTTAAIQVTSGGAILDTGDAGGVDLTASTLELVDTLGIGTSSNPLETAVSHLEADAGTGGFWLVNQGALEVGNVTSALHGITAGGIVFLHNVSDLSITEDVVASQGPLTLTVDGTLTVAASVTSGAGFLQIDSTGDLSLTATGTVEVQQGTAGMLLQSGAGVVMNDGSLVQGADGDIAVQAVADVTLSDLRTTAQIQVTSGGAILDTNDAGAVDLTAGSALLTAASGIGTPANPLETALPLLEADAGAGGLWLDNQGDLQVGGVSAALGGITAGQAIALSTTGTLTITEAIAGGSGPITLSSATNLTLSSSITSGGGRIELSSAAQVILGAGTTVDVESGTAGVLITAAAGIQMAPTSAIMGRDGDVALSTGGTLALAQVITTADVNLQATQVVDANDSGLNVTASGLFIDAASIGQPGAAGAIDTSVAFVTASASAGSIYLLEQNDVVLESLTASTDIVLTSGTGTIVVQTVSAGGQVTLTAAASITDDADNATTIAASVLNLSAGQGIGLAGDPATAQLDTAVGQLFVTSTLGFDVANTAGNLLVSQAVATADAAFGRIVNATGDLLLGVVTLAGANTTVHLQTPAGSVLDTNAAALNLTATHLGILGEQGVGTAADPLETNVRQIEIQSQSGSVFLSNTGALEVTDLPGFNPSGHGITAFDGVNLFATGTIVLSQPVQVTGPGTLIITSTQDLSLASLVSTSAGGAQLGAHNSILASPLTNVAVQGGDLQMTADLDGSGAGTIQFFGNIAISGGNAVFQLPAPDGLMAGAISGSGGLVKQGAGTVLLTANSVNSYTGPTLIQAGTLIVDGQIGSQGPAAMLVLDAQTTLSGKGDINAPIFSAAATAKIVSSGNLSLGDGSTQGFNFAGQFLIGDGHFVTLRDADLAELGTMTLLGFGSTLSAPNGVEITAGEQLGGNGLVDGDVFVRTGGRTSAGLSTGILTTRDLDLNAGSTFLVEINGTAPGMGFDQFNVLGDVAVAGAQLAITGIRFRPSAGTEFVILNNDGIDPIVGQFAGANGQLLAEGATIVFNGIETRLSYVGGDSNDISLTVAETPLFFVPGEGGLPPLTLTANVVAGGEVERSETALAVAAAAVPQKVQVPPAETVVEFRRTEFQQQQQQQLRIYFKVVNDALGEEWEKEYDLPVERYAENALVEALNYFRTRKFPSGHYRIYIMEPGAAEPRVLADIHIQEGKIVPPDYREEPGEAASQQKPGDASSATPGADAAESTQTPDSASQNGPTPDDRTGGDQQQHEGGNVPATADPQPEPRAGALVGVAFAGTSTAALARERVYAALGASRRRVSRAARLLRRPWKE